MVDNRIIELGNIWKSMPRNNAEEIAAADNFYNDNIMPLSTKKFLAGYAIEAGNYDLMFVTVGTSWQPAALSIMANKPKRVVFITTVDVLNEVTKALTFMKKEKFILDYYEIRVVDKARSESLFYNVKEAYDKYLPRKACFDITGGTKAMVAAAAMIAEKLNMKIYYVESNYLSVYRHPEPGSERLVKLARPQNLD